MALPTILVNSATGSDTQASGAGPATALFGTTNASTNGTGLIATLPAGTDLSGVATDGSHVLFLLDTTAGARNFSKITGTAGSGGATPTVTVANAFGLNLTTKTWAIGGKRASIGGTTSTKLFSNNSAAGDAMPGWIVQMESGHAETIAALYAFRRAGNTTDGPITLKGTGATYPILTFSVDSACLVDVGGLIRFEHFELRNSNASKTASIGIRCDVGENVIKDVRVDHATDKFWKAFICNGAIEGITVRDCTVKNCANVGMDFTDGKCMTVINCYVKSCGSHGIFWGAGAGSVFGNLVQGNILAANGGDGLHFAGTQTTLGRSGVRVIGNTFDANTGDGVEFAAALTANPLRASAINNNIISNNGGYGIRFSGASISDVGLYADGLQMSSNCFYANTSGQSNLTMTLCAENTVTTDPTFANAASDNYEIGTNLKALGYPIGGTLKVGAVSATDSYVDIGAAQREEAGGGAGGPVGANMRGGFGN
jgi:hypothetical protein